MMNASETLLLTTLVIKYCGLRLQNECIKKTNCFKYDSVETLGL